MNREAERSLSLFTFHQLIPKLFKTLLRKFNVLIKIYEVSVILLLLSSSSLSLSRTVQFTPEGSALQRDTTHHLAVCRQLIELNSVSCCMLNCWLLAADRLPAAYWLLSCCLLSCCLLSCFLLAAACWLLPAGCSMLSCCMMAAAC